MGAAQREIAGLHIRHQPFRAEARRFPYPRYRFVPLRIAAAASSPESAAPSMNPCHS